MGQSRDKISALLSVLSGDLVHTVIILYHGVTATKGVEDSEIALGILRSRGDVEKARYSSWDTAWGHDSHNDGSIAAVVDLAASESVTPFLLWVLRPSKGEYEHQENDIVEALNREYGDVYGEYIEATRDLRPMSLHTTLRALLGIYKGSLLPRYTPLKRVGHTGNILFIPDGS